LFSGECISGSVWLFILGKSRILSKCCPFLSVVPLCSLLEVL
jgi:hypothetical protein